MLEYYQQDFPGLQEPTADVLYAVKIETGKILGEKIAQKAHDSLALHKWVNTADHHGLLCHPYFYSAALARSHSSVTKETNITVTLPFGGISLGNDSFPRGFFFHDTSNTELRIFFKSLEKRRLPVYALEPMTVEELLHEKDRSRSFSLGTEAHERLAHLFSNFLEEKNVWIQQTYSAQLTAMNQVLWKTLFNDSRGDFVYLEIDSVVNRLLLEKHLCTETEVYNLLFNAEWRGAFVKLFSGVTGSHTQNSGTHLFWYIDYKQETRRQLFIHKDALTTPENDVSIPLTPESIAGGLLNRTLMPSSALLLITLHGVEKLASGGGSSQLSYLAVMMQKWQELLQRFAQRSAVPTTSIWCGDNTLFQIVNRDTNETGLATLTDCFLYLDDLNKTIDSALSSTSIAETVDAIAPVLYGIYTKQKVHKSFSYTIPKIFLS